MAQFGPIPKAPEDRVRRNKTGEDGLELETFDLEGEVKPPRGIRFGEKIVQDLWDSLLTSVNRKFYEPTDWAYAKLTLYILDSILAKGEVPGAMLLTAVDGMMTRMLLTEADRRRLKIEVKRAPAEKVEQKKTSSEFYREEFKRQAAERGLYAVASETRGAGHE